MSQASFHRPQRVYSKDGSALRASLVPPTRPKLPSTCFIIWLSRITTSRFPTPKKPPTPMTAYDLVMSGATTISSTVPILSLVVEDRYPKHLALCTPAKTRHLTSSNAVTPRPTDPATCACAMIDTSNAMLAHIRIL